MIERAVVLCQTAELRLADLLLHEEPEFPEAETGAGLTPVPGQASEEITVRMPAQPGAAVEAPELRGRMEEFERAQIVEALAKTRGNQTLAAKLLGIARRTLIKKIIRYGIERPRAETSRTAPRDNGPVH